MALLFNLPRSSQFDAVGELMSGWTVEFYDTDTSTPRTVYANSGLSIPLGVSVAAGDDGSLPPIYLDDSGNAYKVIVKDANGEIVPNGTIDPYLIGPSASQIAAALYPRTTSEQAEGVTPAFLIYAPSPKIDVRRHLTAWDDGSSQTTGLQTAINLAYAQRGRLILPNGLDVASGALSLTMDGDRTNQGFAVEGPGWNAAQITQTGSPAVLLKIAGATPSSDPNEAPIVLEGFSLLGVGKTAIGLQLNGVGYWRLSNVQARGFNYGLHLKSALLGVINDNCMANENNYGLVAERDGASPYPAGGSGCNRITVTNSVFNLNSTFGMFLDSGANWAISNLDLEGNGTSGNINTGAIRITSEIDDDIGYAQVALKSLWMEANFGTPLLVDSTTGLTLSIRDTLMLNNGEGTSEILISGADRVSIRDTIAPAGGGAIWNITASYLTLDNVLVGTLTDSGVTYPNYRGAGTASAFHRRGRASNYLGTLTGCSGTAPTGTIEAREEGDEVTLDIPLITGTSTSTAATITGMPAALRPSAQRVAVARITDNGTTAMAVVTIETSGTITLTKDANGGAFTSSGTKGIATSRFSYKK